MARNTRWVAAALAPLLGVIVVLLSVAPASAATRSFRDPRGDAPARFDLIRVGVANGDVVSVRSKVRNLEAGITQIYVFNLTPVRSNTNYYAKTVRRANGTVTAKLYRGGSAVDCGVHGRWRLGRSDVRISLPQDCLSEHRRIRVNAAIGRGNGSAGDPADWTKTVGVAFD